MAEDFSGTGDHRSAAESLSMALELLPPGHKDDKARLRALLEDASTRALERDEASLPARSSESDEDQLEILEALEPEDAREAVMALVRRDCTSIKGVKESEVIDQVVEAKSLEEVVVREALDDLLDEGLVYRNRPGHLMVDGIVEEEDVEAAVLALLGELSTEGRGGSRKDILRRLTSRGFSRDAVEEAIDDLEESGRLEEAHRGQLRPALAQREIMEVHHHVVSVLYEMDPEGRGVLVGRIERELSSRGCELEEVLEAIEELVDDGELLRVGNEVRTAPSGSGEAESRELMEGILSELATSTEGSVPVMRILRAARGRGMKATLAHRALEELMDLGAIWKDAHGIHAAAASDTEGATGPRELVMGAVRHLLKGHQGAPRIEVIDAVVSKGIDHEEAREVLEGLIDDGLLHDTGGGFLRPG